MIVEVDPVVAELMRRALEHKGYQFRSVTTAAAARSTAEAWRPDLIILDLILPDEDGLVLCNSLKAQARVPILVCSGTRRARDEVLSLKLGADDFISKPFDIHHLSARVEALLQRWSARASNAPLAASSQLLRINDLAIDEIGQVVRVAERPIQLTPIELRLLVALARQLGELVPRRKLAQLVWGERTAQGSRRLDVHIGRLRAKLAQAGGRTPAIVAARGFGYKLTPWESAPTRSSTGSEQNVTHRSRMAAP